MRTPCQYDPELWLSDDAALRREAASKCIGCPIIVQCGEGALARRETFGVWGGIDLTRTKWGGPKPERATHCGNPDCGQPIKQNLNARARKFCSDHCQSAARNPINHGTEGGYRAHHRRKVPLCEPCRRAYAVARADRPERAA